MRKYILMQAPKEYSGQSSRIVIIDKSGIIGTQRTKALADEGWTYAGCIDSDLDVRELRAGFSHDDRKCVEKAHELLGRIRNLADESIFI